MITQSVHFPDTIVNGQCIGLVLFRVLLYNEDNSKKLYINFQENQHGKN